ncbi:MULTISPECIES: restriction endonuclease subunit S [Methanobrevibacter]|uniref:Type I restriction enzyme S subunit n=1 Tax=Methanobrevibacter gottschalkii DSM 11977 TaxID=1122229 RepID=A0A3N5B392_9EURY|nr:MULTISPECIES: restriction endonuclease subunit S [Methanobrevibacter]OEC94266.1 hypothetical protein A9505_08895 [Methanobrevibacter sp. A27]RPF51854.1 type I restriction enzyme S subunit [Methanobrevibacter gottschalkii DSM 11977]
MIVKKLEDIAEVFSGVQISRFIDLNENKFPVIKNKFVEDEILDYHYENISKNINKKYYSKKGDIIISLSQPNTVSLLQKEGFIIPMYFAIIRLNEGYDSSFIYHLMNSDLFHNKLHVLLEGGTLRVIKVADLKKMKINIPNFEKQNDYGKFLDLIDKKCKLLNYKKSCNEKIKEYLIQTQLKGE